MSMELHRRWRWFLGLFNGQAYFWTREWQAGVREAEADIAAGRVTEYDSVEDLWADLFAGLPYDQQLRTPGT
jgi:hypothetical protein